MCTGMKEWREEIIEETTERVEKETAERVERETAERLEVQNTVNYAQNLIDNEGFSIERALAALGVPEEKRSYYSKKLREASAG